MGLMGGKFLEGISKRQPELSPNVARQNVSFGGINRRNTDYWCWYRNVLDALLSASRVGE